MYKYFLGLFSKINTIIKNIYNKIPEKKQLFFFSLKDFIFVSPILIRPNYAGLILTRCEIRRQLSSGPTSHFAKKES